MSPGYFSFPQRFQIKAASARNPPLIPRQDSCELSPVPPLSLVIPISVWNWVFDWGGDGSETPCAVGTYASSACSQVQICFFNKVLGAQHTAGKQ